MYVKLFPQYFIIIDATINGIVHFQIVHIYYMETAYICLFFNHTVMHRARISEPTERASPPQ